jgi:hypothetical protein
MNARHDVMAATATPDEGIGDHGADDGHNDPDHDLGKKAAHAPMAIPLRQKCGSAHPHPEKNCRKAAIRRFSTPLSARIRS